jgi:hypothetical protein
MRALKGRNGLTNFAPSGGVLHMAGSQAWLELFPSAGVLTQEQSDRR